MEEEYVTASPKGYFKKIGIYQLVSGIYYLIFYT